MDHERDIKNKTSPPLSKRRLDIAEDPVISDRPDVPTSQKDHFCKEWLLKFPSGSICYGSHIIPYLPIDLQVVPDSATEIAAEEEMIPIFLRTCGA